MRRHRDYLWMLGGEVIRCRQDTHLSHLPVEKVAFALPEEDCGPFIWPRITGQEQDAFDVPCRKPYRFLTIASEQNSKMQAG